jgi:hypothetical protein
MKIEDSQNLKWDPNPIDHADGAEKHDPDQCLLDSFIPTSDSIELHFANGSSTVIKAKNTIGVQELVKIEKFLPRSVGKSYKEILEMDF